MWKISQADRLNHCTVITCTYHDGKFMGAKAVKITGRNGKAKVFTKIEIHETKQCFNNKPIRPMFGIFEDVSDSFLQVGNKVAFEF